MNVDASFMPSAVHTVLSTRLRTFVPEIFGTITSGGAALTAWQVQAQWAFSIAAASVAMIAGLLTIRSLIRKEREGK